MLVYTPFTDQEKKRDDGRLEAQSSSMPIPLPTTVRLMFCLSMLSTATRSSLSIWGTLMLTSLCCTLMEMPLTSARFMTSLFNHYYYPLIYLFIRLFLKIQSLNNSSKSKFLKFNPDFHNFDLSLYPVIYLFKFKTYIFK